ncbi:MAG TPA: hypothetical protein VNT20_15215 [Flavisolibacter sp.]|jgi:dipeptidyl aminopeptidase/acylaminoacyl peptidase|nr:hypothetical protein [Flavisolibacter sp.]
MRCALIFVVTVLFFSLASAQKKDEINFSDAYQLDSSEYFLIPRLLDDSNKDYFDKGKGYILWGHYTDLLFYNTKTNQAKKLLEGKLALISPFLQKRSYYYSQEKEQDLSNNILPKHIIYSITTDDFNGDRVLDSNDPSYLYVSTKTGEQLRQITPNGFDVMSWTISKDKKIILVKGLTDKNKNKKFGNGDDQLFYRIDLDDDISKIQCYQVNL